MEEENAEAEFLGNLEAFRAQAVAAVELSKHYRELRSRFESGQTALKAKLRELDDREERVGEKEKASKSNLLCLKSLITKHAIEANLMEVRVRERREVVAELEGRVSEKEEELRTVERHVEAMRKEWEAKREEVDSLEVSREAITREIRVVENSREEVKREVDSRVEEFRIVEKALEECCRRVEAKEREIMGMCKRLEMKREEFEVRVEEIRVMEKNVAECLIEIAIKESDLESLEISIRERARFVDSALCEVKMKEAKVEERAVEIEMLACRVSSEKLENEKRHALLEKSIEDREKELSAREKALDSVSNELEAKERKLNEQAEVQSQKEMDLVSVEKSREDREKNLNAREELVNERVKYLDSVSDELKLKDMKLNEQAEVQLQKAKVLAVFEKSIEERKEAVDSMFRELELKERHIEESDANGKEVKALQMSVENLEKEMERKRKEWSCKLELTEWKLERLFEKFELRGKQVEPIDERQDECLRECLIERELASREKLLKEREESLDSMLQELKLKESYIEERAKQLELKQTQFDRQVKTLLEQQDRSLDAVQLKIEAVKQLSVEKYEMQRGAMELKSRLSHYWLVGREVQLVLVRNSMEEFEDQFSRFRQSLQDQIKHLDSLSHAFHSSEMQMNTENLELTVASEDMIVPQSASDLSDVNMNVGSFDMIAGIIQNLIERKQLVEAVKNICNFKQISKFPLAPLLEEYMEDAKWTCIEIFSKDFVPHDEKVKVVDGQIADLRDVIQSIRDHGFELQYPLDDLTTEIEWHEELKENPNLLLSLPLHVGKQQNKGRKRTSRVASPPSHTYKLRKRALTA